MTIPLDSTAFIVSYCILSLLFLLAGLRLAKALSLLSQSAQPEEPDLDDKPLIRFEATRLDGGNGVCEKDLMGAPSTLVFLEPADSISEGKADFARGLIHKLWHRTRGRVFLLCSGSTEECVQAVDTITSRIPHPIESWVDHSAEVRKRFGLSESPTAVRLNWRGELEARGKLNSAEKMRTT
jgi:hypothetical protein